MIGREPKRVQVVVIGGGQAGLSVGYHLKRRGIGGVILEANARVGDTWRKRWDSLRLFTPAQYDGLDGHAVPGRRPSVPDQGRDGGLPRGVRGAVRAARADRRPGGAALARRRPLPGGGRRPASVEAEHVVVAMASYQRPQAAGVRARARPRHRAAALARLPQPGASCGRAACCSSGAGNSGAEIALETVRGGHPTWMSGRRHGPRAVPDRRARRPPGARAVRAPGAVPPGADGRHADRPEGAAGGAGEGRRR